MMNFENIRNNYGVVIVLITFISRVVFVGFSWSYGTILAEFKKNNSTLSDTEMSWIASIGQSFGGLLAPMILYWARCSGFRLTFIFSLTVCVFSLFLSSLVDRLHWLLLTYSFPYGFANASIFILGTLICGIYYPVGRHPQHILVMCLISTGFPIGYHIMSSIVFTSMEKNGWNSMNRRIGLIELIIGCAIGPFFTTRYSTNFSEMTQQSEVPLVVENRRKLFLSKEILYWMLAIFAAMCAINNFLLHLHGQLEFVLIAPDRADLWFRFHGLFDAIFRLGIPLFVHFYPIDVIYLFPMASFTGIIVLSLCSALLYTSLKALTIVPIILFSLTSSVVTALQYTVSNRLFDDDRTEQGYVYHVIVTSLGTIVGPVIGGIIFDFTGSYKSIIPTSVFFLFVSFVSFCLTIVTLNKKKASQFEETLRKSMQSDYGSSIH